MRLTEGSGRDEVGDAISANLRSRIRHPVHAPVPHRY